MPSAAFSKFNGPMLRDVHRLIELHDDLNPQGGRRGLAHITRSCIVLLCAAFELYIEEALIVVAEEFCNRFDSPQQLPQDVQRCLVAYTSRQKNELAALDLAGDGWKTVYVNMCNEHIAKHNTPKSHNIELLYKQCAGYETVIRQCSVDSATINGFVSRRGDIAHRGADSGYVLRATVDEYIYTIKTVALEIDNALADHIQNVAGGNSPWRRRYQD